MVGLGLFLGGVLGNLGELAAFGRVTDFIPFPPGWHAAPADLFTLSGYALFSAGILGDLRRARERRVTATS
jgi:lipoprotein signal peptidase